MECRGKSPVGLLKETTMAKWIGKYFKKSEFQCSRPERPCDCGLDNIHPTIPLLADEVRHHLGVPIEVLSGVRCIEGNKKAGGRSRSYHIPRKIDTGEMNNKEGLGLAADFSFADRSLRTPLNLCRLYMLFESIATRKYCKTIGIGIYPWGVHVDFRGNISPLSARWSELDFPRLR